MTSNTSSTSPRDDFSCCRRSLLQLTTLESTDLIGSGLASEDVSSVLLSDNDEDNDLDDGDDEYADFDGDDDELGEMSIAVEELFIFKRRVRRFHRGPCE